MSISLLNTKYAPSLFLPSYSGIGYVDSITTNNDFVRISGWGLIRKDQNYYIPNAIGFSVGGNYLACCEPTVSRPDVCESLELERSLSTCGFEVDIDKSLIQGDPLNEIGCYVIDHDNALSSLHGPFGMVSGEHPAFIGAYSIDNSVVSKLTGIAISLTSRCNLRCGYCYVKSKEYVACDLDRSIINNILDESLKFRIKEVHFGIMGEPTIDSNFFPLSRHLVESGLSLSIATNLSTVLTDEQIDILLSFHTIEASIDTFNAKHLKLVRTADVKTILYNLVRIKARSKLKSILEPRITLSIVLNELTAMDLPELASVSAIIGIGQIQLLDMRKCFRDVDFSTLPLRLSKIPNPSGAITSILQAIDIFRNNNIRVNIDSSINAFLENTIGQEGIKKNSQSKSSRLCIAPWSRIYIQASGDVTPCFHFSCVGRLNDFNTLNDVVNGTRMKRLRRELLTGDLKLGCQDCVRAEPCTPEETQALVDKYLTENLVKAETFGQPVDFMY